MYEAGNLIGDYDIPDCHNLKNKLLSKFINARLHFYCKNINENYKRNTQKKRIQNSLVRV